MSNKKSVTIRTLINALQEQREDYLDTVTAIGTISGMRVPYRYVIYCKREDGTMYEIRVKEE